MSGVCQLSDFICSASAVIEGPLQVGNNASAKKERKKKVEVGEVRPRLARIDRLLGPQLARLQHCEATQEVKGGV